MQPGTFRYTPGHAEEKKGKPVHVPATFVPEEKPKWSASSADERLVTRAYEQKGIVQLTTHWADSLQSVIDSADLKTAKATAKKIIDRYNRMCEAAAGNRTLFSLKESRQYLTESRAEFQADPEDLELEQAVFMICCAPEYADEDYDIYAEAGAVEDSQLASWDTRLDDQPLPGTESELREELALTVDDLVELSAGLAKIDPTKYDALADLGDALKRLIAEK